MIVDKLRVPPPVGNIDAVTPLNRTQQCRAAGAVEDELESRQYTPNFGMIVAPRFVYIQKQEIFSQARKGTHHSVGSSAGFGVFQTLVKALLLPPTIELSNLKPKLQPHPDASEICAGAVLTQTIDKLM